MSTSRAIPLCRPAALFIWTALALLTCLLLFRRLAGEFSGPIPTGIALLWSLATGTASCVAAGLLHISESRDSPALPASPQLGPYARDLLTLGCGCGAAVAGIPGTNALLVGTIVGGWAIAAACRFSLRELEDAWLPPLQADRAWTEPSATTNGEPELSPSTNVEANPSVEWAEERGVPADLEVADDALQTQIRRCEDGEDVVEGTLQIAFDESEREMTAHVAFCPPLPAPPRVEVEDVDGSDWDVKVSAAFPFGLRLSIRRRPGAAATGRVGYSATAPQRKRAA